MAITSVPSNKHAFLFTGNTDARWVEDLKKVFKTLTQYYNYPASQVKVVSGDASLSAGFMGTTPVTVADKTALATSLSSFMSGIDSADNTIVFYFTGVGSADLVDPTITYLEIKPSGETIDQQWLSDNCFGNIYSAFIYVIMQQAYSGGFVTAVSNIGSTLWTFTSACTNAETSGGDATGSYFTDAWTSGLQFGITGGKHAFELAPITDPYPSPGGPGMMINMKQAYQFAVNKLPSYGCSDTPDYQKHGADESYLGLPKLYIRDGNPHWWETPDIWLTRRNDTTNYEDLYLYDDVPVTGPENPTYTADGGWKNFINMRAWNIGTHPVRIYSIAAQLNRSGLGLTDKQMPILDIGPDSGGTGILLPEDKTDVDAGTAANSAVVQWNYPFYSGVTHRCARAEVELKSGDVDFTWMITSGAEADIEAQRNLDPAPIPPPPPPPVSSEDPAEENEDGIPAEPENGADAPGTGTDQGSQTFRGIKEHIYEIKNPFDKPRKFVLQFPDEYLKHRKYLAIDWHRLPGKKDGKLEKLDVKINNNLLFLTFKLEKGESAQIKAKMRVSHKFSEMGEIRLPFNILVEEDRKIKPGLKTRTSLIKGMRSISGFTVVIWPESVTLEGRLFAAGKKPLPETKIRVETSNGQRWVNLITDKYGAFRLSNICPDTYRITVVREKGVREIHMVNMNGGKYRKIELHPKKQVTKK
jgi:hypothetical protein